MLLRSICIIGLVGVVAACGDNQYGALKRQWNKAQKTDTQEAYMAYMGAQGFATDLAHPVDEKKLHQEYFERRNEARSRIFEMGLETARGTCPFSTLYVDLRQNVAAANGRANFPRWYRSALEPLGVSLVDDPAQADATLIFELNGAGIKQGYVFNANAAEMRYATSGGKIAGAIWIAGDDKHKVTFEGYAEPSSFQSIGDPNKAPPPGTDYSDVKDDISRGITSALSQAYFHHRVAELIYNSCSPAAGVFLNFYDNVPQMKNPMPKRAPTVEFYARMAADYEETKPMLFAAAMGAPNTNYIYQASGVALDIVTKTSMEDRDLIWKAFHGPDKPGPWEIIQVIMEPGQTLEEKLKE